MRIKVASLLLVLAFGTGAMAATITVDGVEDYGAYCVITDATGDTNDADVVKWGFAIDRTTGATTHGTLYTFFELATNVAYWQANECFAGVWIDADMDTTTNGDHQNRWWAVGTDPTGLSPSVKGNGSTDLIAEWGFGSLQEGYNFWGHKSASWPTGGTAYTIPDVWGMSSPIDGTIQYKTNGYADTTKTDKVLSGSNTAATYSGNIIELAVDLDELNWEYMGNYGKFPSAAWWIGGRVCGHDAVGTSWDGDSVLGTGDIGGDGGGGVKIAVGDPAAAAAAGTPIKIGDYNWDGSTNAADLDSMTRCMASGINNALKDITGDNNVTGDDLTALLQSGYVMASGYTTDGVVTWRGDCDLDGDVDETDYGSLLLSWQATGKSWVNGDYDGDGDVDETDYGSLLLSWQNGVTGVAGGPIPEPVTLSLLSLGGLALLRRRK